MEQGSVKQRKVEEFVELIPDEEREITLQKDNPAAVWPAAGHVSRGAAAPPFTTSSSQRAAAYLSSSLHERRIGGGHRDGTQATGQDAGSLGRPRDSARRSPFLVAAQQQLGAESSSPGKIPGQLVSPTKRDSPGVDGRLLGRRLDSEHAHGLGSGIVEVEAVEEGDVLIQVKRDDLLPR